MRLLEAYGKLVTRQFTARPLHSIASTLTEWPAVTELAVVFWRSAAGNLQSLLALSP